MTNHYETLGVALDAQPDEIKTAYRGLVKDNHPDRMQPGLGLRGPAEETLKAVNLAFEVLKDPDQKTAYDRSLGIGAFSTGFGSDITNEAFGAYTAMAEAQANMVRASCEMWASYFGMWGNMMKQDHQPEQGQTMDHTL